MRYAAAMSISRFTFQQLIGAISLSIAVLGTAALAIGQAQRCIVCGQQAARHVQEEQSLRAVAAKMKWYVGEHLRYQMPRAAADADKMAGWFAKLADRHAAMSQKYRHATWRPWESLPSEPN